LINNNDGAISDHPPHLAGVGAFLIMMIEKSPARGFGCFLTTPSLNAFMLLRNRTKEPSIFNT
jgi:hypothetical protein